MANALGQAGATVEPSEFASLAMDEHFTGLWTQRNPLRDADVPYLYRKFYSASRFDSILDGINREISARLTDVRRAGSSVYNNQVFPPGYSFYPYKWVQGGQEIVNTIYDGKDGSIYNASFGQKSVVATKSSATAHARFLTVGSTLYITDGGKTQKYVQSQQAWTANTIYNQGDFIIDSNGNIQMAIGAQTGNLTNIQVENYGSQFKVTIWLSPTTPVDIANNVYLHFNGLTTEPSLNGLSIAVEVISQTQFYWVTGGGVSVIAYSPETGTVDTSNGQSGATQPVWQTGLAAVTPDGGLQWVNKGSALGPWGGDGPTSAPVVSMAQAPSVYPTHAINTWYAPNGQFVITDPSGNIQQLITGGVTGATIPASWGSSLGAVTNDGSCQWKMTGSNNWQANHAYAVGQSVLVSYTYYITVPVRKNIDGTWVTYYQQQAVTATSVFQVQVAGQSGTAQPNWNNGTGTTTRDFQVTWLNIGPATAGGAAWPGATQTLSIAAKVVSETGYLETATVQARTGATAPTWATDSGASTVDGNQTWVNSGPFAVAHTGAWQWAYSGKDSITNEISPPSPTSAPLIPGAGMLPVIQGQGLPQPPWDTIVLWRTAQDGVVLLYDDEFPNPGPGQTWIYTDSTPDEALNSQMPAPGSTFANTLTTPPPATATAPEWHCGRIFMINGSYVIYSGGSDTVTGNGNSAFPPGNYFQLPEQPVRLKSITMQNGGLIVFCVANTYVILGDGTGTPPFQPPRMYMENVGLMSYDALCMVGSTFHGMSNKGKVFSFDPANGYLETGFPIGDQFKRVTTAGPDRHAQAKKVWTANTLYQAGDYIIDPNGYMQEAIGAQTATITNILIEPTVLNGNPSRKLTLFFNPSTPLQIVDNIALTLSGLTTVPTANGATPQDSVVVSPTQAWFYFYGTALPLQGFAPETGTATTGSSVSGSSMPATWKTAIGFATQDGGVQWVNDGQTLMAWRGAALYDPATTYVTWHEKDSGDTGLYVADGAVGWFRWSPIAPPESGSLWSPRAAIVDGTSCVQSIEISPGVFDLLMGPATNGPIRMRDPAHSGDWSSAAGTWMGFPSWDTKGSIGLCETGEVAEIVHIALRSVAVGTRPRVSLLLDELAGGVTVEGQTTVWEQISLDDGHHEDPPNLEPSITMFSDRYRASDTAENPKCENFQLKIDYGTQTVADELLKFAVYGGVYKERRQQ